MDQEIGCAVRTNFAVPSVGRGWTEVFKVSERELVRFCRDAGEDIADALERRGRVSFVTRPDGGATAITFSSATPHYGVGGPDMQTSMVFFSGTGAAAYLSTASTPSANFYNGMTASGDIQDCHFDAVLPVTDVNTFCGLALRGPGELGANASPYPANLLEP